MKIEHFAQTENMKQVSDGQWYNNDARDACILCAHCVKCVAALRYRVRSSYIRKELRVELLLRTERSLLRWFSMMRTPSWGSVLSMCTWKETTEQTQKMREESCVPSGLGRPRDRGHLEYFLKASLASAQAKPQEALFYAYCYKGQHGKEKPPVPSGPWHNTAKQQGAFLRTCGGVKTKHAGLK